MHLKEKVVKGFAWTFLQGAGTQLISLGVFIVLARLLEPAEFGIVAMATVAISFLKLFSYFGFGTAIIQRENLEDAHLSTAFWVDVGASLVMMAVTILSASWIAVLYDENQLEHIIQILSVSFVLTALSQVQTSLLRRNLAFRSLAQRTLIAESIAGVIGIGMAVAGLGVWSLVGRQLAASVTGAIILWVLSGWRPVWLISYKHFKDLFGFSINMMGANIVDFFSRKSDSFLIGYFLGAVALGYYTIAYRLIELLTEFIGGTVNRVAWPAFARLQSDLHNLRKGFYSATQMLALIVFPVFAGLFAVAPEVIPFMFGSQWTQSIVILQILVFIGMIHSISKMFDTVIVSVGRPGLWLSLRTGISFANVVAFLFAMRWGIVGVALAYVTVGFAFFPVYLAVLKRVAGIGVKSYMLSILSPAIAAMLMTALVILAKQPLNGIESRSVHLGVLVATGVIAYIAIIRLIDKSLLNRTIDIFKSVFPNHRKRAS